MHYLKRMTRKNGEEAVSPVVGVMLMLVVTIIIAAVVSGFAGGLVGGQSKSPTLSMDVKVVNTGSYIGSGFFANVNSVSQPISTSKLKIVTTWETTMKNNQSGDILQGSALYNTPEGTIFTGGNTSLPNSLNMGGFNMGMKNSSLYLLNGSTSPFGMGAEISSDSTDPYMYPAAWFGQYTLQQGVDLFAFPYGTKSGQAIAGAPGNADYTSGYNGVTPYTYMVGSNFNNGGVDATIAVLGAGWEQLQAGDVVHVNVIYTPTGTTIFSKDVPVTEG